MKQLPLIITVFGLIATMAQAQNVGVQDITYTAAHHEKPITGTIWYPTDETEGASMFGDNLVFEGTETIQNAAVADGTHPIVALSHGMGGLTRIIGWLGAGLAKRGAIVIAVNHPNTTFGDRDMAKGIHHWTRAQDMSSALDYLLNAPAFRDHLDSTHITAAGFSYGGWTALSLAGVRANFLWFHRQL